MIATTEKPKTYVESKSVINDKKDLINSIKENYDIQGLKLDIKTIAEGVNYRLNFWKFDTEGLVRGGKIVSSKMIKVLNNGKNGYDFIDITL